MSHLQRGLHLAVGYLTAVPHRALLSFGIPLPQPQPAFLTLGTPLSSVFITASRNTACYWQGRRPLGMPPRRQIGTSRTG